MCSNGDYQDLKSMHTHSHVGSLKMWSHGNDHDKRIYTHNGRQSQRRISGKFREAGKIIQRLTYINTEAHQ